MKQELIPLVPMFKGLLAGPQGSAEEEDSPACRAHAARSHEAARLSETLAALVFRNEYAWFERDDDWVAECLAEWVGPEAGQLFFSSLREGAQQSDLELFVDVFGGVVERWLTEAQQARPQQNPDFDPDAPVEGTQYCKYARLPGTDTFQWLYASEPESDDWQTIELRYERHEAEAAAEPPEDIRPYEEHFIKLVGNDWKYGATADATIWYDEYQELLAAVDAAEPPEDIRPYEGHFIKLVGNDWKYGATADTAIWYDEYQELLAAEGLLTTEPEPEPAEVEEPEEPEAAAETVGPSLAVQDGLDDRAFDPQAELSPEEAQSIIESPAGQVLAEDLAQKLIEQQAAQVENLLAVTEDLSEEELTRLLELVQQSN